MCLLRAYFFTGSALAGSSPGFLKISDFFFSTKSLMVSIPSAVFSLTTFIPFSASLANLKTIVKVASRDPHPLVRFVLSRIV